MAELIMEWGAQAELLLGARERWVQAFVTLVG